MNKTGKNASIASKVIMSMTLGIQSMNVVYVEAGALAEI